MKLERTIAVVATPFFGVVAVIAAMVACGDSFSGDDGSAETGGNGESGGETAAPSDGGDAGLPDVKPSGPSFCTVHESAQNLFCDDFESTSEADNFGFKTETFDFGKAALVADGERTAVLRVTLLAGAGHRAVLEQPFAVGNPPAETTLEVDFKIESSDTFYATLTDIHLGGFSCEQSIGLGLFGSSLIGPTRNGEDGSAPAMIGSWHHASISLKANPYTQVTTIDGVAIPDRLLMNGEGGIEPCIGGGIRLGLDELGTGDDRTAVVLYDNVLLRKGL